MSKKDWNDRPKEGRLPYDPFATSFPFGTNVAEIPGKPKVLDAAVPGGRKGDALTEAALIGAVLLDCKRLASISFMREELFYAHANKLIWKEIDAQKDKQLDTVSIAAALEAAGRLEYIGGSEYLDYCCSFSQTDAMCLEYAEIVANNARNRRILEACARISDWSYGNEPAIEARSVTEITEACKSLGADKDNERRPESQLVLDYIDNRNPPKFYQTGIYELDCMIDGFEPHHLAVIASRPSVGKSSFLLTVLLNMSKAGVKIGMVSLEQSRDELSRRMVAILSGVSYRSILKRCMNKDEQFKVIGAIEELESLEKNLFIYDLTDSVRLRDWETLETRIKRWDVPVVFVDYGQKIQVRDNYARDDLKYHKVFHGFKDIATSTGVSIICASQINRMGEDRPSMANMKGGGAIEEAADEIIILHREDTWPLEWRECIVAKAKNGPTGRMPLWLNGNIMKFEDANGRFLLPNQQDRNYAKH